MVVLNRSITVTDWRDTAQAISLEMQPLSENYGFKPFSTCEHNLALVSYK